MSAVSFMSEHTAEYILVPKLVKILSQEFSHIIPFYFWSSREGNTMSRKCAPSQKIRLIAVYARRPKIEYPGQDKILVKFNTSLVEMAKSGNLFGIPVFAGIPLVSSIIDFTFKIQCSWFRIIPMNGCYSDFEFHLTLNGNRFSDTCGENFIEGPLEPKKLVQIVLAKADPMTWEEGIENLRRIRAESQLQGMFPYFGGYKPFYLLLM